MNDERPRNPGRRPRASAADAGNDTPRPQEFDAPAAGPPRDDGEDLSGDQSQAVNRSRPIYPAARPNRWTRGGSAGGPGARPRSGGASGTGGSYRDRPQAGGAGRGPSQGGAGRGYDRGGRGPAAGGAGRSSDRGGRGPAPAAGGRGPRDASRGDAGRGYDRGGRPQQGGGRSFDRTSRGPAPGGAPRSSDRGSRGPSAGGAGRGYDRGSRGPAQSGGRAFDRGGRGPSASGSDRSFRRPEGTTAGGGDRPARGPRPGGPRRDDRSRGPGAGRRPDDRRPRPEARRPGANGPDAVGDRPRYEGFTGGYTYTGRPPGRPDAEPSRSSGRTSRTERRFGDPQSPQRRVDPHPNRLEPEERFVMPDNPREAALRILHDVDTRGMFSDRLLDGAHSRGGWDPRDEALLHELVKGTLRWRGRIDWVLDQIVHIGIEQVQPWVRNVLRLGAYQILFLDRIPDHAAVDEAVKLANQYGHAGTAGLANSVLRRLADEKDSFVIPAGDDAPSLAAWGSHPLWLVERWLARFGVDATRALMMANNRHIPVGLRVNPLRGTRDELIACLAVEGVTARPAQYSPDLVWIDEHQSPGKLAAFKQGYCTIQDESEALVGRLVGPQPHERLLDLCAAPGGKSTHLAELMGDEGEVWAMERAPERVQSLEAAVARLGVHSIHVVQGDGRSYAFPMPFDRVLVDAPCSGLGVLGRRADARWRKTPDILTEMPAIQLDLLGAAGLRLRPGGVLVYSVCSFEPEETTELVERFLHTNPAFVHEDPNDLLPEGLVDENGFMRVLPHIHGCDGAFAARFRKI